MSIVRREVFLPALASIEESDPDPTLPTQRCSQNGCPCTEVRTAGDRLLGAAEFLELSALPRDDRSLMDAPGPALRLFLR